MITTALEHKDILEEGRRFIRINCSDVSDYLEKSEQVFNDITRNKKTFWEFDPIGFCCRHKLYFLRIPLRAINDLLLRKREVDFDFLIPGLSILGIEEKQGRLPEPPKIYPILTSEGSENVTVYDFGEPSETRYTLEDSDGGQIIGVYYGRMRRSPTEEKVGAIVRLPMRYGLKNLIWERSMEDLSQNIAELKDFLIPNHSDYTTSEGGYILKLL